MCLKSIFLFCFISISYTLSGQTITTVAGGATGHGGYWGEGGLATNAQLETCSWVSVDAAGNLYIGDMSRVLKVDAATGIVTTMGGTGVLGYNGENIPATSAQVNWTSCNRLDHSGNLYIADAFNYRIRKVNLNDTISDFVGNGTLGTTGNGGLAIDAEIYGSDFTWDIFGNFYMGDRLEIRKIDSFGIITRIIGTGMVGPIEDGIPATATNIGEPMGIATDQYGNIYFSDSSRAVREVNISTGIIHRVAGTGDGVGFPYSGDGTVATACHIDPFGIYVDDTGNLYIAGGSNERIYIVDTAGIIHTIAGSGTLGHTGDGGAATAAEINDPHNIAFDACGNMYFSDYGNTVVRKVTFNPSCNPATLAVNKLTTNPTLSIYPNPAHDELTITTNNKIAQISLYNMIGQVVYSQAYDIEKAEVNVSGLPVGVYVVRVRGEDGSETVRKVVKE